MKVKFHSALSSGGRGKLTYSCTSLGLRSTHGCRFQSFFLFTHCLRPIDQRRVYKYGKILVFQSNCTEYDFRTKSLLLWQSLSLKGRRWTSCNISNISCPHMAKPMCHSSWFSFYSVAVTDTGGCRQPTENERQITSKILHPEVFEFSNIWVNIC